MASFRPVHTVGRNGMLALLVQELSREPYNLSSKLDAFESEGALLITSLGK